ncbi:hypothetical protein L2E82_30993 [Cichorium intybus]|uniref:Uncharacterized protein n=1 Tax=Cichorium intybus TaxID=13427 RepID=A0ACB9D260_CICIN|nr:hypothetical protein L2E82_30993 [Cichorium intybus]
MVATPEDGFLNRVYDPGASECRDGTVGATPISEPFNRLSWGKSPTSGSKEFSLGLVVGGLVDDKIDLIGRYRISMIESKYCLVRGLKFSCLSPKHLASGAEEGERCI